MKEESRQGLSEASKACKEEGRLLEGFARLARMREKLCAFLLRLLLASPPHFTSLGISLSCPSPKLWPKTLSDTKRTFETLERLILEVKRTWKKLILSKELIYKVPENGFYR